MVSWNLTRRCNLRCKHCYLGASTEGPEELSTEESLRILGEIAEVNRETVLILSGGEPLLRSDLDVLIGRAAALGMTAVLGTNGTFLTPERAGSLGRRGLKGVGISVDSLVSSRHDEFRGFAGAWAAAREGIEAARAAGLDVQVQMTLTRDNFEELPVVARFARDAGARALAVFFLVCTGRGQGLVDLTPDEHERALRMLAGFRGDNIMIRPRCAPTFRRVLTREDPDSFLLQSDAGRCMAAKNYCRITPEGDVTPCPYLPLVAGSLRERSFGEIWRSAPLLEALREPALHGRCGACEYRELCGGCRARAFAASGDPLDEDPWCGYVPGSDPRPASRVEESIPWTPEAESLLQRVPFFVRRMVRSAVESFARRTGIGTITPDLMVEARRSLRVDRPSIG